MTRPGLLKVLLVLLSAAWLAFLTALSASYWTVLRGRPGASAAGSSGDRAAESRARGLERKLEALKPQGVYIQVDTGGNRLYLMKGGAVVREAMCSTGSGVVLHEPNGKRQWVFDTPRGLFAVKSKISNPYWVKPDWAFIEEGEPIPRRQEDRVEGGVLGDYALGFGEGFFIHGTLYTRLLGRSVTHGCVRAADADLKVLYQTVPIGSRILIY